MLEWKRSVTALVCHPRLWPTALAQAGRMARPGWWRRPPFLPLPDPDYLRFRLETQYGSERHAQALRGEARRAADRAPDPSDMVTYLRWCREQRLCARPRR